MHRCASINLVSSLTYLVKYDVKVVNILQTCVDNIANSGSCAWPSRKTSNDVKIGAQVDYGDKFLKDGKQYCSLVLQANKGAKSKQLKQLAAANSHQFLALPVSQASRGPSKGYETHVEICVSGSLVGPERRGSLYP
jgi:hypothetical protein